MKKNIIATLLLLIFILGMTGCKKSDKQQPKIDEMIAAGGDTSFSAEQKDSEIIETDLQKLPTLTLSSTKANEKNATVTLANQTTKNIVFSECQNTVDVYKDSDQNQYSFNASKKLVGYTSAPFSKEPVSTLQFTIDQADAIARKHIAETYGEHILDDFVLESHNNNGTCLNMNYFKRFGTDDSIIGEFCIVWVNFNGSIDYSNIATVGTFDDFNEDLLNNITESSIEAFAKQQTEVEYPEKEFSGLNGVWLCEESNGYYLKVLASLVDSDNVFDTQVEYIYPLQ